MSHGGQRKRFADGKVTMPFKHFLGYDRGEGGVPVINEKEAEVVRMIYRLFLQGKTAAGICKHLMEQGIFISSIKEQPFVLETWDEGLWLTLLETATVHADNRITFRFKDGTYIEVGAE